MMRIDIQNLLKRIKPLSDGLILLVLMMVWPVCVMAINYDNLIIQAEQNRLTNPAVFNDNLSILKAHENQLTQEQSCLFEYLKAYQLAYSGQYEQLNSDLELQLVTCQFPAIQARIYALMANTLVISGKFEASLVKLDASLRLVDAGLLDDYVIPFVYSAASIVYDAIDQPELSIKYAELTQENEPNDQNLCKANYFTYKQKVENLTVPIDQQGIESTIKQCKDHNLSILSLFLNFYYLKHQVDAAYSNDFETAQILDELLALESQVEKTQYPNLQSFYWAMVAYIQEKLGNLTAAETAANTCLEMNQEFGDTEQKIIALEVKLQVALQRANEEAAYALLKERTESEQRRFNEKQAKLAAFMKVKHDNLAQSHEIAMLNQKNKLLEMEQVIAKQNESNQKLLLLLLCMLLAFFVLWIWRAQRRQIELKKLSESDHLTQVLNRQGLEGQVKMYLGVAEEQNQIVHMAILDLDHFKKINDIHGHLTGDWVLKNVVKACKKTLKNNMLMGRLGGEEFAVWLFDYSVKEAKNFFEEMRQAVAGLDCTDSGYDINITASFGLANSINSGFNITQLLRHADEALYQAKESGRNQVVVYQHDMA